MRKVDSKSLGSSPGAKRILVNMPDFPENTVCPRVRFKVTIPIKSVTGQTLDNTDAVDIMTKFWGTFNLRFGRRSKEVVDQARTFADMRLLQLALTGRDHIFNGVELNAYSTGITIGSGATKNVVFEVVRSFVYERLVRDADAWIPGTSQMEQLYCDITRGAAFADSDLTQDGDATIDILFDELPGEDRWSPVPRIHIDESTGLDQKGPAGALLMLLETSAVGLSTSLTLFTLKADDDEIHAQAEAADVVRDATQKTPNGSYDLNLLATVLYQHEEAVDLEDILTAGSYNLRQHAMDLDPMLTRWLYVPEVDEQYADSIVGANLEPEEDGEQVKVTTAVAERRGGNIKPGTASVSGLRIFRPTHPLFDNLPGRVFQKNRTPGIHIPDSLVRSIAGATALAPGREASAAAEGVAALTKFVPGASSSRRGRANASARQVAQLASPGGLAASVQGLMGRLFGGRGS